MLDMKFKNKKEEEEWRQQLQEAIDVLQQQPVHFFKAEHIPRRHNSFLKQYLEYMAKMVLAHVLHF